MNDHQKGREGWQGETMPIAVRENEVENYLRHKWLHGLILLFTLCRGPSSRYLELHFARYFLSLSPIYFFCKINQKYLQSLYSEVLLNFIS